MQYPIHLTVCQNKKNKKIINITH
uniref:Uncharacterized protein n=1 Tax=Rhizophora mucronata TaxID=61149 RepID=A0A2P2Q1Z6_RHIMU